MSSVRSFSRPVKPAAHAGHTLYEHLGLLVLEIVAQPSKRRAINKWYRLTRLASDFGLAFRLHAGCGDRLAEGAECYDVLLDGHRSSCTCKGWEYTGGCKHLSALLSLQAEGRLS
jgi:hypothetical protein